MTRRIALPLFLLAALLAGCRSAAGPAREAALDPAELVRALEATTADWNQGDLEAFIAPYAAASTFMTRSGPVGREQMRAHYRQAFFDGTQPKQALRFERLEVRPLGADHALMTGRYVLSGGGEPERSGWFTLVWTRTPEGWRILHDHSS